MHRTLLIVLTVVLLAGAPAAQTIGDPRNTMAVVGGGGQTWDDEGSLGSGLVGGVRIERRLFGNTRAELAADLLTHDRDAGYFKANGRTTLLTLSLAQRFSRGAVQPYVMGGFLLASHSGSVTFDTFHSTRRSHDTGLAFGGGVAVRLRKRLEIGPEIRFLTIAPEMDIDPALAYWIGLRLAARF